MARGDPTGSGGSLLTGRRIHRRRFLAGAGAVGAGAALSGILPGAARAGALGRKKQVRVYKLSTYGMHVCQACKLHGVHKFFRTRHVRRAHDGCNCRIVHQKIPDTQWVQFFVRKNGSLRKAWDDRW